MLFRHTSKLFATFFHYHCLPAILELCCRRLSRSDGEAERNRRVACAHRAHMRRAYVCARVARAYSSAHDTRAPEKFIIIIILIKVCTTLCTFLCTSLCTFVCCNMVANALYIGISLCTSLCTSLCCWLCSKPCRSALRTSSCSSQKP